MVIVSLHSNRTLTKTEWHLPRPTGLFAAQVKVQEQWHTSLLNQRRHLWKLWAVGGIPPGLTQNPLWMSLEHKREGEGRLWHFKAVPVLLERFNIENDIFKGWIQKASGLALLSEWGMKLMRLFFSPSVKVYYQYFKGREQGRANGRCCSSYKESRDSSTCWDWPNPCDILLEAYIWWP